MSFALGQTGEVVLMTPNVVAEMTVALHVKLSEFIVESRHTEISDQLSPLLQHRFLSFSLFI